MNPFRAAFFIVLFTALSLASSAGASMTYEYDLPGLVGIHQHIDKSITVPFVLKAQFSSIASVEIRLEGRANPGLAVLTKVPEQDFVLPVDFRIKIAEKFIPGVIDLTTSAAYFGPLHDFFQEQQYFIVKQRNAKPDWSFLKDGAGELHFGWGAGCPDGCRYVNHASVEITRATLVIKGDLQY